ncbi:hypothetical protein BDZ89DRAFT_938245 [Hymenopellis radicata]|nr:hypothetical protein BDZ89DRAFT_938245 [Hymenopellis radicata]
MLLRLTLKPIISTQSFLGLEPSRGHRHKSCERENRGHHLVSRFHHVVFSYIQCHGKFELWIFASRKYVLPRLRRALVHANCQLSATPYKNSSPNIDDVLYDSTLHQFNKIANQDVEMQVRRDEVTMRMSRLTERTAFLVIDTNILLHHFDALVQFVADVESSNAPVVIVVPGAVIKELDGHKNNPELRWFASTSSTWLLKKVKERNKVRGQASAETKRKSGNWRVKASDEDQPERLNDFLILDASLFYASLARTILWSGDYNLCIDAQAENMETIENTPEARRKWSSRYLIHSIFGPGINASSFHEERVHFNRKTIIVDEIGQTAAPVDPDAMDVDNTPNHGVVMTRFDVRDDLHRQTRNHFTMLLQDLVETVGGKEIKRHQARGETPSRYAPEWQKIRTPLSQWSASECLVYLDARQRLPVTSPRLETFLRAPYSGAGARRGQDWSRADWQVAIRGLTKIGEDWKDEVFLESAATLDALLGDVYEQTIEL